MRTVSLLMLCILSFAGCYALGQRWPLWGVPAVQEQSRPAQLPEHIDEFERRISYTDIWTQC